MNERLWRRVSGDLRVWGGEREYEKKQQQTEQTEQEQGIEHSS